MATPSKTSTGGRDSSQLAIAAEELIKAACTHVDSTSIALGKETVDSLKELSAGSAAMKASVDAKLNTLNQSISSLKDEIVKQNAITVLQISALKTAIDVQTKDQKIQWAFSNAEFNSFNYYEKPATGYHGCDTRTVSSSNFVKLTLLTFKQGDGRYIINRSMSQYGPYTEAKTIEEGEKQFRDKLSQQIHDLLGHKPRISVADNGYAIYYS